MKRVLPATAIVPSILASPVCAQVQSIDLATTGATEARTDIAPPGMETNGEILLDAQARPGDGRLAQMQNDKRLRQVQTDLESNIDLDASLPGRPTIAMDLKSEFEPEPDPERDIDAALGLKINNR